MKSHTANFINALVLIILGAWGYFGSESPSFTALIPVFAGLLLLLMTKGIKKDNKVIGHIAVVLTLILLFALVKPLTAALGRDDMAATVRVSIMMLGSLFALVFFVKSFIDARKNKKSVEE